MPYLVLSQKVDPLIFTPLGTVHSAGFDLEASFHWEKRTSEANPPPYGKHRTEVS